MDQFFDREKGIFAVLARYMGMTQSLIIQSQLLATKFFVPITSGTLISRPRLHTLLDKSLKYPLTLVSAPAGFGKTTLLSTWAQSLPASTSRLCWISLVEEDNDPQCFWTSVLSALDRQEPERFTRLLVQLQSPSHPSLTQLLIELVNLLMESTQHFVLILDDYQIITQEQVHTTLSYLLGHLPPQLRIILSTRADPPLPLSLRRAGRQVLEIRTEQLRCTIKETKAFFKEARGLPLPDESIQAVNARTEGWLVGLQLLAFSLQAGANPATLLQEVCGEQHYILDYLTEVVLGQQPQEVQTFLLSTCLFERLTASLCDAVMQQTGSQQMLQRLERTNLFVVALDSKREWYRYHALFAEALCCLLEKTHPDLVPMLHQRASLWYAQHNQTTEAILHAFKAREWQWAAELIEGLPLMSLIWGVDEYRLTLLKAWLEQLPADVVGGRPRLCLVCTQILWAMTSHPILEAWLDSAETTLTAALTPQADQEHFPLLPAPHTEQDLKDLLAEVLVWHAFLWSYQQKERVALTRCQQALALLSAEKYMTRAMISLVKAELYATAENDVEVAIQMGVQAFRLAQQAGQDALVLALMGVTVRCMIDAGRLHEAERLVKHGRHLGTTPTGALLPQVGWLTLFQAELLRQWNQLDAARATIEEAIELCQQEESMATHTFLFWAYAIQVRILLSRTEMDTARCAYQQLEQFSVRFNQPAASYYHALFTTVDQVRLWLACGEVDRATQWVKQCERREQQSPPFGHEREEVACVRVLLATAQPDGALQRLGPVLQRATEGRHWGHVIEMRLLQALAYQMRSQENQALSALSEAIRLGEPDGYIRCFVDEGATMRALLSRLREEYCKDGPPFYLDALLAAFPEQSKVEKPQLKQVAGSTASQHLLIPLSEREREVLQLLVGGASNQEIAQELVIALDTVKRHISHIFSKLDARNRVQASIKAIAAGLIDKEL
jgi:LuxR family maltose regulon positive regulatory protein